ncbi:MAG: fructose,6-bisphosphatase [Firmicutes bacterium]|nr:fructose,6-bisphosphatase [Bacillota bacterium]
MVDQHYLQLLAREYPTSQAAAAELIRLEAFLSLPKGTEFFFSDLHGEHEAFIHLLRSASGFIRTKIDDQFEKSVSLADRVALSNLISYPERELALLTAADQLTLDWCKITIYRLLEVCKLVSAKYTRFKVRRKLPPQFANIIDELLHVDTDSKSQYFTACVQSIDESGMTEAFITSLCLLIQRLAIDKIHVIGDIFDRGPRADAIMSALIDFRHVDFQWGNHDISWMGAQAGNWVCIASVIRLGISYNNFDSMEDGYGINLRSLSVFAAQVYRDDPCTLFTPHILDENIYDPVDPVLAAKMHKAIAIIQFKVEGQLLKRHPEYGMDDRRLLEKINFQDGTITLNGHVHELKDKLFPTVDPNDPLKLTPGEEELMKAIAASFRHSEKLQKHIRFLYDQGSMYLKINNNLLYHGCIPVQADGSFDQVTFDGQTYSGKAYLDYIDKVARLAQFAPPHSEIKYNARDFLWYLWCGPKSPLFGKNKMATFERYFIADKTTHKEVMSPYYQMLDQRDLCENILREFGLDPANSHIINGHVPVKLKAGESPVKGGGLLYVIDGGISKAYQSHTGIGGYTLIYNSRYLALAEHTPYHVDEKLRPVDLSPKVRIIENMPRRVLMADTDEGQVINSRITELKALLQAFREGLVEENAESLIAQQS